VLFGATRDVHRMRALLYALLPVVAACSFDRSGISSPDAFDPEDDGGGTPRTWRDDSVDDFAASGSILDGAVVEPWGAIGPRAFLTGALVARASDQRLWSDLDSDPWPILDVSAADGWGLATLRPDDWGAGKPPGMSIGTPDEFAYWAEGEILLETGQAAFRVTGDDAAILDVGTTDGKSWTRVATAAFPDPGDGSYAVTEAAWHPIRVAHNEGVGDAQLLVEASLDGGPLGAIPRDALRARADDVSGLAWAAFDDERLLDPIDPLLWRDAGLDYHPTGPQVVELGLGDSERFSMRWAGQFWIGVAGAYALRVDSDDGQRLWVDGQKLLDAWDDAPHDQTAAAIELDVGWHDLVVDLTENTGDQRMRLTVVDGPELAGAPLPLDRLRPVIPRFERAGGTERGGAAIPDNGAVTFELDTGAPAGAKSTALEIRVAIDHQQWNQLEVAAIAPNGTEHVVLPVGGSNDTGNHTVRWTIPLDGVDAGGAWTLRVRDSAINRVGNVSSVAMTVRYDGGQAPIAPYAVYESAVEDLGAVIGFDRVTWNGRIPPGASVQVRLRGCNDPAECTAEPWSEPVANGARPQLAAHRYAQYRLELSTDGDRTASVDVVDIDYRAAP
jgi:hypothetical protein